MRSTEWQWGKADRVVYTQQHDHRRDDIPAPQHPQTHLNCSKWRASEPDWPSPGKQHVASFAAWCQSEKRSWRGQWSPLGDCTCATEAKGCRAQETDNPRYDLSALQIPGLGVPFYYNIRNRFQALSLVDEPEAEEENPVNRQCKQVRSIFNKASKNCLGMQKTKKSKEWITPDTWKDIEERRRLKKKTNDSISANRHVKRKIRTDSSAKGRADECLQNHQTSLWEIQQQQ